MTKRKAESLSWPPQAVWDDEAVAPKLAGEWISTNDENTFRWESKTGRISASKLELCLRRLAVSHATVHFRPLRRPVAGPLRRALAGSLCGLIDDPSETPNVDMPRLGVEFVSKEAKDDGSASTTVPFEALGLARWPLLQVSAITKDVSIPPADWIKLEDMRTLVGKLQVRGLPTA